MFEMAGDVAAVVSRTVTSFGADPHVVSVMAVMLLVIVHVDGPLHTICASVVDGFLCIFAVYPLPRCLFYVFVLYFLCNVYLLSD